MFGRLKGKKKKADYSGNGGGKALKRPPSVNKLKSLATSARDIGRRKTQHLFDIVTKAQHVDEEFDQLNLQFTAYEDELNSLRKKLEPFAESTRQYCNLLEGASLQAWVMSHRINRNEEAEPSSSIGKVQAATKTLNDYQDQIGDTRRVVTEIYDDEVMGPINALCKERFPAIKALIRKREDYRKDRDTYSRRLKHLEAKKGKSDAKKLDDAELKASNAEELYKQVDAETKTTMTRLLEDRPKIALSVVGFMACHQEFLSRTAHNVKLSCQFLPQPEASFFKHSIVAKLSGDTDTIISPPPMYMGMKGGNARSRKSIIIPIPSEENDIMEAADNDAGDIPRPMTPPMEDDANQGPGVVETSSGGLEKGPGKDPPLVVVTNSCTGDVLPKFFQPNPLLAKEKEEAQRKRDEAEAAAHLGFDSYKVVTKFPFKSDDKDELSFEVGQEILVLEDDDESGWAAGEIICVEGSKNVTKRGLFPINHTEKVTGTSI
jgi:hypothetical protein